MRSPWPNSYRAGLDVQAYWVEREVRRHPWPLGRARQLSAARGCPSTRRLVYPGLARAPRLRRAVGRAAGSLAAVQATVAWARKDEARLAGGCATWCLTVPQHPGGFAQRQQALQRTVARPWQPGAGYSPAVAGREP